MDQKKSCSVVVNVNVDKTDINETIELIEILHKKIQEVKSLSDEVSSRISDLSLEINI